MTQNILVLAGKKQSGKSSGATFVAGYTLAQLGRKGYPFCPTNFTIDDEGQLIVNTVWANADGGETYGDGVLDLTRMDDEFVNWASNIMWPHVKIYNFADTLKQVVSTLFGIPMNVLYGTNENKNQPSCVTWKDMSVFLPPRVTGELKKTEKYEQTLTVRELLQYFGTNVCRKLYDRCWVDSCFRRIAAEGSELAIIADCRFPNEVKAAKEAGAKVIKLMRQVDEDAHESEMELDKVPKTHFDLIIDNTLMTIKEKNQAILDALYNWGWLNTHINLEK